MPCKLWQVGTTCSLGWCVWHCKNLWHCFLGRCSMRLASPNMVVGRPPIDQWSSSDRMFSPLLFAHFPPEKTWWPLQINTEKSDYLYVKSNEVIIFFVAMYLVFNSLLNCFSILSFDVWFLYQIWSSFFYCYFYFLNFSQSKLFFNLTSYGLIWLFVLYLVFILFKSIFFSFLIPFFIGFVLKKIPRYLVYLTLLIFKFSFYVVIRSHDLVASFED